MTALQGFKCNSSTHATWLGREGTSECYYLTSSKMGPRVDVQTWLDTREIEIKGIDGDGRTDKFRKAYSVTLDESEAFAENIERHIYRARAAILLDLAIRKAGFEEGAYSEQVDALFYDKEEANGMLDDLEARMNVKVDPVREALKVL
jgi:hypothetical protein